MLPPKPGRPKGGSSYKNPFEHSPGRIKYASPVAKQDASRVFKRAYVSPVAAKFTNKIPKHIDFSRTPKNSAITSPQSLRFRIGGTSYGDTMLNHRSINLAIINETRERIDQSDIEQGLKSVPQLMHRVGSSYISYKVRRAKNWLDEIGSLDIVIAINYDDRAYVYDPDRPRPATGYKLDVHIPEQLLHLLVSGALSFVEPLDRAMQQDPTLAYYASRVERANNQFSWAGTLDGTEKGYNARLDLADAGARLYQGRKLLRINPRQVNTWQMARSIRKQMRPYYRVDASKLNRQLRWIGANIGKDVQVLPILKTSSKVLNSAAKELGTLGSLLTATIIYQKATSDTWTASTVVDGALLFAGIFAVAFGGLSAIIAISVAYGAVDLLTDDALSSMWDEIFPRNKPFAPSISSFYVNH